VIAIAPELVRQAQKGDENAYTQIVESLQSPVFNLCFRMLSNSKEAEDAAQETFWRAYKGLNRYDSSRSFETWILAIAAHHCIDLQRRRKLPLIDIDTFMEETEPDRNTPNPESALLESESQSQLQLMLSSLPDLDRATLIFRYWYEYSEEEISQSLDISVSAVKSRLHRARRKMANVYLANNPGDQKAERMRNESPVL